MGDSLPNSRTQEAEGKFPLALYKPKFKDYSRSTDYLLVPATSGRDRIEPHGQSLLRPT